MVGLHALCTRTALGFGLLLVVGLSRVPPPAAAQGADGATFLGAFGDAWATGAVEHVLPLFAAEAVLVLDCEEPVGPEYYGGSGGPTPLRAGVEARRRSEAQLDLAGAWAAETVLGGAPAIAFRWTYRLPGSALPIPPEVGQDELVLRGGRIHAYTRTPDPSNRAARALALDRYAWTLGRQSVRAAAAAPSPQERRTPAPGPWALAAGLALVGALVLAAFVRPNGGPWPRSPGERRR